MYEIMKERKRYTGDELTAKYPGMWVFVTDYELGWASCIESGVLLGVADDFEGRDTLESILTDSGVKFTYRMTAGREVTVLWI